MGISWGICCRWWRILVGDLLGDLLREVENISWRFVGGFVGDLLREVENISWGFDGGFVVGCGGY